MFKYFSVCIFPIFFSALEFPSILVDFYSSIDRCWKLVLLKRRSYIQFKHAIKQFKHTVSSYNLSNFCRGTVSTHKFLHLNLAWKLVSTAYCNRKMFGTTEDFLIVSLIQKNLIYPKKQISFLLSKCVFFFQHIFCLLYSSDRYTITLINIIWLGIKSFCNYVVIFWDILIDE